MELIFKLDPIAMALRKKRFDLAQTFIDDQALKLMTPYVPVGLPYYRNSGKLRDSGEVAEPGAIVYTAPFARSDYYANVDHAHGGNPQATRLWFETMKHYHAAEIFRGAAKIIGGRR
ncbi:MAG: hypothetical protein IJ740_08200 [Ruminococcus sp.]|nr:hypothetical protein [Ruminococcus sp.]